jgi:4-amino-4-deoxy-L-arabinose transferase-like glycosyltransferase
MLAAIGLYLTAPKSDDFFWSDAPRHALNGAFILDLLREHPLHNLSAWAMAYYVRYPALTILFYPPFFYGIEAVFFAMFGVSHAVAQLAVCFFAFLLGLGAYAFGRLAMGRIAALGLALMLMGAPEMAFWSRQVMLDIPAYAMGVAGMVFLALWLQRTAPAYLYLSAAALLAAVYTKYTAGYLVLPATIAAFWARGWRLFLDRHVQIVLILGIVLSLPALYLLTHFGDANFGSVAGRPGDLPRFSPGAWLFYARQIPGQLGYAIPLLALCGLVLLVAGQLQWRLPTWLSIMLIAWIATGYICFSLIEVREPRHDIIILFPLIFLAAMTLDFMGRRLALGSIPVLLAGVAVYAYSVAFAAPPVVTGYRDIAAYVAGHAPKNGVVLFAGYRDGNFVFAIREHTERPDLTLIRADKLLLTVAVERIRGVQEAGLDETAILSLLKSAGVSMVVAQADFWQDIPQMARLYNVLRGDAFHWDRSFPITGDLSLNDGRDANGNGRVDIFQATYPVKQDGKVMTYDLPIVGHTVTGRIGAQ